MPSACRGIRETCRLTWFVLTWAATIGGCTLVLDVGQPQCESASDCSSAGFGDQCIKGVCAAVACEGDDCPESTRAPEQGLAASCGGEACEGDTRCFDNMCIERQQVDTLICGQASRLDTARKDISVIVVVREFSTGAPPLNLNLAACRSTDVNCDDPVATFEDTAGTGDAMLAVPRLFEGFFQVTSDDLVSGIWYSSEPLTEDRNKLLLVPTRETYETLSMIADYESEPNKGIVVLEAQDCDGQALGGVYFTDSKGSGEPYVIANRLPNKEEPLTIRDDANNMAWGGFINADPGFSVFSAFLDKEGPILGKLNAYVRAEWLTYVDFVRPPGQIQTGAE